MYKTTLGVHDPTIIYNQDNQSYYMFSTDTEINGAMTLGIQIRKSKDLKAWDYLHTALEGIPTTVFDYTNPSNLWAPEVIAYKDGYRMYYSASIFGTNKSCINLAEANTPEGPWIDRGLVIATHPDKDEQNAIDANLLYDKEGQLWMVYGSFFSGIYIVRMDEESGLILEEGDIGICIANRSINVEGAIEGPFIYYNKEQGYYYLFVSYDFLGKSYNVRTARSKNIQGPYLDYHGLDMFEDKVKPHQHGLKLLGSYKMEDEVNWTSIGHNSILDKNGIQYMVAHSRINHQHHPHYAYIRPLLWLESGWPVCALHEPIEILDLNLNGLVVSGVVFDPVSWDSMMEQEFTITHIYDVVTYRCNLENGKGVIGVSGINDQGHVFMAYLKESL